MKKTKVKILSLIWNLLYPFVVLFFTYSIRFNNIAEAIYALKYVFLANCNYIIISYLIILSVFFIIKSIIKNNFKSNLIATILLILISVISYYKYQVLQNPFVPSDILLIGNINQIAKFGLKLPSANMIFSIDTLIIILLTQLVIEKKLNIEYKIENWQKELYRIPLLLTGIIIIFVTCIDSTRFSKYGIKNDLGDLYTFAGANTVFFMHLGDFYFPEPNQYSKEKIEEIKNKNDIKNKIKTEQPNIILIMNESFSDPTKINVVEYSQDPLKDIRELANAEKNCKIGNIVSPVLGGGTSLPEFEVLTGLTSYFLEKQTFPYTSFIRNDMNSIVRTFNNNEYNTVGIHTNTQTFYNRKNVYKWLGFEKTIFSEDIKNPEYKGGNISDNEFANQIIKQFESTNEKKFIFGVTMQNHMPYTRKKYEEYDITITSTKLDENEKQQLENYTQGIYDGNKMYIKLVNYLKKKEEPTILIMFGDHLPSLLKYDLYEKSNYTDIEYYETPYIIWSNYEMDFTSIPQYMSTGNLGINVLELSNIDLPWYLKEFKELYEEYPVITNTSIVDNRGKVLSKIADEHKEIIEKCEMLQYDLLIRKKYIDVK